METSASQARIDESLPASRACTMRLIVPNALGLHPRPAAMLARTSQEFDAQIVMECGGKSVNARSILGILTLCAAQGTVVTVTADGPDADGAIRAIEALFACSFHEEEPTPGAGFLGTEGHTVGVGRQRRAVARTTVASAAPRSHNKVGRMRGSP